MDRQELQGFDQDGCSISQYLRYARHDVVSVVPHADNGVRSRSSRMFQKQLKRFFTSGFAEVREGRDITADNGVQRATDSAENGARPYRNSAHDPDVLRDLEAIQRERGGDHVTSYWHRLHCNEDGGSDQPSTTRTSRMRGVMSRIEASAAALSGENDRLTHYIDQNSGSRQYRIKNGRTKQTFMASIGAGLEGVVATTSSICYIDGDKGILSYCGYNIDVLASNASFEEVAFLLWNNRLPKRAELDSLKTKLVAERDLPPEVTAFLKNVPKGAAPMDVLRTAVSLLSLYDPQVGDGSIEANVAKAIRLTARIATLVTSFDRLRNGRAVVPGDPSFSYAANFLYTLTGKKPDQIMERVLDVALILHADHELSASTFSARITAATLSDMYSSVTGAIGALKGPLHGGANEAVILMLLKTASPEEAVVKAKGDLINKVKVPGFGHRVYNVLDPRAIHLKKLSEQLGKSTGHTDLYEKSSRVEKAVRESKGLNANVDFYSASCYYSLGVPVDMFTPLFAVGRMPGWTAHILEQYRNNRLIRPRADYIGAPDGQPWVPIEKRG